MKGHKTGGRTKGTPNKATAELKDFAGRLLRRKKFRTALGVAMDTMTVPAPVLVTLMHYYAGKPTEHIELTDTRTLEDIVAGTPAAAPEGKE